MLPFSPEEFFALFARYNLTIWPAQVVAYGWRSWKGQRSCGCAARHAIRFQPIVHHSAEAGSRSLRSARAGRMKCTRSSASS